MTHRSIRGGPGFAGCPIVIAALLLAGALCVPPAGAATGEPAAAGSGGDEGWKRVFSFAHCAVNVFRAVTPADWVIAVTDCSRLYLEEPPLPGGGQP